MLWCLYPLPSSGWWGGVLGTDRTTLSSGVLPIKETASSTLSWMAAESQRFICVLVMNLEKLSGGSDWAKCAPEGVGQWHRSCGMGRVGLTGPCLPRDLCDISGSVGGVGRSPTPIPKSPSGCPETRSQHLDICLDRGHLTAE